MKTPHIVSVQHTGSCFMMDLLDCECLHANKSLGMLKVIARDHVVVTPLRDPRVVFESWTSRNNKLCKYYMQQWNTLKHLDACCNIFYVPIDIPERDECIQALSRELDRELKPDWDTYIRCTWEPSRLPYSGVTPISEDNWEYLYNLPMIKRFYKDNG